MKINLVILSIISLLIPFFDLEAAEFVNVSLLKSDHNVLVEYDLVSDTPTPVTVNVDITVQGVLYAQEQLSLEGDVAKHVLPGKMRKFTWNAKRDFPKWPDLEVTVQSKTTSRQKRLTLLED